MNLPSLFRSDGSIGGILLNEIVVLENVTYVANASIIVGSGASIIFKSDSEVSFLSDRGIYVKNGGIFRVDGNTTFISKESDANWYGIVLDTNNDTILQHLMVNGAKNCMKQESDADGLISLEYVTFQDCSQDGIRIDSDNSEVIVTSSQVSNVGGYGIYSNYMKHLELVNSLVANCSNDAVYLFYAQNVTLLRNTIVQANSNHFSFLAYRPGEVLLESNVIQCWYYCFYIEFDGVKEAHIYNNTISGLGNQNAYGMAYIKGNIYGDGKFFVSHNSFQNWSSPNYVAVEFVYSGLGNGLLMANNSF